MGKTKKKSGEIKIRAQKEGITAVAMRGVCACVGERVKTFVYGEYSKKYVGEGCCSGLTEIALVFFFAQFYING